MPRLYVLYSGDSGRKHSATGKELTWFVDAVIKLDTGGVPIVKDDFSRSRIVIGI